ncbi:outer-membrane lipoprotein carrier protein [Novosphingobium endophyticum]|uniref:Outer-membrane lipoprotein carrier protein n=1 Tax=Novosphingobium endophyticum TaxID=1955250 RepID=A0A916TUG6_9SPHN|nr:outer membrane lipoprotein carrier protein LolA [Novosphingobium endophyticum]GGC10966.1 outer-membrane lipoprotein carrier protein [Novosphingobium endophyticum]
MTRIRMNLRNCAGAAALAALAVPAIFPNAPALAATQSEKAQLNQVVEALRGISTMRADFVQTDRSGQSVTGTLTLKRPGRIRFQYEKSVNMLIVSDGKALTMVDYDVNQVQRWPISNSPLGALLDPKRDVARYGTIKPTGNPDVVSVEVRDSKHPEYGIITLIFTRDATAPGGLELAYWVALDSQNKRTTIQLKNQRYGVPVTDKDFRWTDPRPRVRR